MRKESWAGSQMLTHCMELLPLPGLALICHPDDLQRHYRKNAFELFFCALASFHGWLLFRMWQQPLCNRTDMLLSLFVLDYRFQDGFSLLWLRKVDNIFHAYFPLVCDIFDGSHLLVGNIWHVSTATSLDFNQWIGRGERGGFRDKIVIFQHTQSEKNSGNLQ